MFGSLRDSCNEHEYQSTWELAVVVIVIWPVGVPMLYGLLLWASRNALRTGKSTHLSRATAFLSDDYISSAFWWETIEMCRKLTLTVRLQGLELRFCRTQCSRLSLDRLVTAGVGDAHHGRFRAGARPGGASRQHRVPCPSLVHQADAKVRAVESVGRERERPARRIFVLHGLPSWFASLCVHPHAGPRMACS